MMSVEMARTAVGRTTIECCVRWCATTCAGSDTAEMASAESWTSCHICTLYEVIFGRTQHFRVYEELLSLPAVQETMKWWNEVILASLFYEEVKYAITQRLYIQTIKHENTHTYHIHTVIWSPSLKCDVTAVKKVQMRFTKRLPGFRNLSYAERRSKLNLTTLELRRLHNDLVMCYKIMFNIIRLEFSNFFTFNTYSSIRGHPYKLYVNHSCINVRKHFFACRVVNV